MAYKKKPLRQRLKESNNSLNFAMPTNKNKRQIQESILKKLFDNDDYEAIC